MDTSLDSCCMANPFVLKIHFWVIALHCIQSKVMSTSLFSEGVQIRKAYILLCHGILCNFVLCTGLKPCSLLWFWFGWWCPPPVFLCPTGLETQLSPDICTFPHFQTTGFLLSARLTRTALPKLCLLLPSGNSVLKMTEPSSGALICCVRIFDTDLPQACSKNTLAAALSTDVKDSWYNIACGLCQYY